MGVPRLCAVFCHAGHAGGSLELEASKACESNCESDPACCESEPSGPPGRQPLKSLAMCASHHRAAFPCPFLVRVGLASRAS
eukprot:4195318-Alexandrium_andersonii.AAC.1